MRRLIFTIGILFCVLNINAKTDTLNISIDDKDKFLADNNVSENDSTDNANVDTTRIMFGKKGITVIKRKDGKNNTTIHIEETKEKYLNGEFNDSCNDCFGPKGKHPFKNRNNKFNPHWGGLELTLNNFMTSDFSTSLPAGSRFLELNTGRSIGVRLNLLEQAIATSRTSGFVTGLGLEINSYYFDSENSNITKSNGYIVQKYKNPNAGDYSKNKLKDTYLTVPLMYEIQAPLGNIKKPLYISANPKILPRIETVLLVFAKALLWVPRGFLLFKE
jgi:hypothetical protein